MGFISQVTGRDAAKRGAQAAREAGDQLALTRSLNANRLNAVRGRNIPAFDPFVKTEGRANRLLQLALGGDQDALMSLPGVRQALNETLRRTTNSGVARGKFDSGELSQALFERGGGVLNNAFSQLHQLAQPNNLLNRFNAERAIELDTVNQLSGAGNALANKIVGVANARNAGDAALTGLVSAGIGALSSAGTGGMSNLLSLGNGVTYNPGGAPAPGSAIGANLSIPQLPF